MRASFPRSHRHGVRVGTWKHSWEVLAFLALGSSIHEHKSCNNAENNVLTNAGLEDDWVARDRGPVTTADCFELQTAGCLSPLFYDNILKFDAVRQFLVIALHLTFVEVDKTLDLEVVDLFLRVVDAQNSQSDVSWVGKLREFVSMPPAELVKLGFQPVLVLSCSSTELIELWLEDLTNLFEVGGNFSWQALVDDVSIAHQDHLVKFEVGV